MLKHLSANYVTFCSAFVNPFSFLIAIRIKNNYQRKTKRQFKTNLKLKKQFGFTFFTQSSYYRKNLPLPLIKRFQGDAVNLPEEENTPVKRVDKIFKHMDKVINL